MIIITELQVTNLYHNTFRNKLIKISRKIKNAVEKKQDITPYLKELEQLIKTEFKIDNFKIYYHKGKSKYNKFPNAHVWYIPVKGKPIVEVDKNNNIKFNITASLGINEKLIKLLTPEEIAAVIAHEIGHIFYYKNVRMSILLRFLTVVSAMLGTNIVILVLKTYVAVAALILAALLLPISTKISKKAEIEADKFAAEIGLGKYLISVFNKIEKYQREHHNVDINWFKKIIYKILLAHPDNQTRICNIYKEILDKYPSEVRKDIENSLKDVIKVCKI